tara:strand:- start:467 stop:709 length:243 start_codon:yes stop_codon:yes gene_type:complete
MSIMDRIKFIHSARDPLDFNDACQAVEDYVNADEQKQAEMLADDPNLAPVAERVLKYEDKFAQGLAAARERALQRMAGAE